MHIFQYVFKRNIFLENKTNTSQHTCRTGILGRLRLDLSLGAIIPIPAVLIGIRVAISGTVFAPGAVVAVVQGLASGDVEEGARRAVLAHGASGDAVLAHRAEVTYGNIKVDAIVCKIMMLIVRP